MLQRFAPRQFGAYYVDGRRQMHYDWICVVPCIMAEMGFIDVQIMRIENYEMFVA